MFKYLFITLSLILLTSSVLFFGNTDTKALSILCGVSSILFFLVSWIWIKSKYKYLFIGIIPFYLAFIANFNIYLNNIEASQFALEYFQQYRELIRFSFLSLPLYIIATGIYLYIYNKKEYLAEKPSNYLIQFDNKIKSPIFNGYSKYGLCISFLIVLIISIMSFVYDIYADYYLIIWIIALIIPAICLFLDEKSKVNPDFFKLEKDEIFFLIMMLLFVLSLLLPELTTIPYKVHDDEAQMGILARMFMLGEVNVFALNDWNGLVNLGFYPYYVFMKIFGDNLFGLRMTGVISGLFCILPFYFLGKTLFNKQIAAVSSIILFSGHTFIAFFRTGFHYNQSLLILLLTLLFLVSGLKNNSKAFLYMSGVFCALGFYFYFSSRILIFVVIFYFVYLLLKSPELYKSLLKYLLIVLSGFIIAFMPLIFSFMTSPSVVNLRIDSVNIFYGKGYKYMVQEFKTGNRLEIFTRNLLTAFKGFNGSRDMGEQYGTPMPMLEFYSSILLILALPYLLVRYREERYTLLSISFWVIFIAGWAFTINAPTYQKMVLLLPIIAIIASIPIVSMALYAVQEIEKTTNRRLATTSILITSMILIILSNYSFYFTNYINRSITIRNLDPVRINVETMQNLRNNNNIVMVNNYNVFFPFDNSIPEFEFLSKGMKIGIINNPNKNLPLNYKVNKSVCFFIQPQDLNNIYMKLAKHYPYNRLRTFKNAEDKVYMAIYFVDIKDIINPR